MILAFSHGEQVIYCRVEEDRVLYLSGEQTGYEWLPLEEVFRLGEGKGDDELWLDLTEKIIKCLPTLEDVRSYVTWQFTSASLGFTKEGEFTEAEYAKLTR